MTRRKRKPATLAAVSLASVIVENPLWRPDRDGMNAFPRYSQATMRARPGTFAWRYGRNPNGLEYRAGNRFAMLWERAGIALASSADCMRGVSSGYRTGIPEGRLDAIDKLVGVKALLGSAGVERLLDYCVTGMTTGEAARRHGTTERGMAMILEYDLTNLAGHFGLGTGRRFDIK